MMEQRVPKIQSEVVYQRKKKTIHDGIEGTKDLIRTKDLMESESEVVYQRKKKTIHDGIEGTKDLVRSRISKKEKDNT